MESIGIVAFGFSGMAYAMLAVRSKVRGAGDIAFGIAGVLGCLLGLVEAAMMSAGLL